MMTCPRVMSKKRATSATYSLPLLPSQGSLPFSPSWPRIPMAHMARTSATSSSCGAASALPATLAADGLLARTRADRRKAHDTPLYPPAALSPDHRPAPKAEGDRADGACHRLLRPARRYGEILGHREGHAG